MTVKKKDRLDYENLYLFRFTYVRLNRLGNRLPDDPQEYDISILGRSLENCIDYVQKRLGQPIHIIENKDKIAVQFCADPDFSKQLQQWIAKYSEEKALAEKRFNLHKHMTKGTVEEPKSQAGTIDLGAW